MKIFNYGKNKSKLGLGDVLKAKANSDFDFEGKDKKTHLINVFYKCKKYIVFLDKNKLKEFDTKSDTYIFIGNILEEAGFKGRDKKSTFFYIKPSENLLTPDFLDYNNPNWDAFEEEKYKEYLENKKKDKYYILSFQKLNSSNIVKESNKLSNIEVLQFFRNLTAEENMEYFMIREKELLEKGYFSKKTLKKLINIPGGQEVLQEYLDTDILNVPLLMSLIKNTPERSISITFLLKTILFSFSEENIKQELSYLKRENYISEYTTFENFMSNFFKEALFTKGKKLEYNISEKDLNLLIKNVKENNKIAILFFSEFFKKIENSSNQKQIIDILIKEDNIILLNKIDELMILNEDMILDKAENIINNAIEFLFKNKNSSIEVSRAINFLLKKLYEREKLLSNKLNISSLLGDIMNRLEELNKNILKMKENEGRISFLDKTKYFFKRKDIEEVKKEKKEKQRKLLELNLNKLEKIKKEFKLLNYRLKKKNRNQTKEKEVLLRIKKSLISREKEILNKIPTLKEILDFIKKENIEKVVSHIDLSQTTFELNLKKIEVFIDKVGGKIK